MNDDEAEDRLNMEQHKAKRLENIHIDVGTALGNNCGVSLENEPGI